MSRKRLVLIGAVTAAVLLAIVGAKPLLEALGTESRGLNATVTAAILLAGMAATTQLWDWFGNQDRETPPPPDSPAVVTIPAHATPHAIPAPRDDFHGRKTLRAELGALLQADKRTPVLLWGLGGSGKTEFARRIAHDLGPDAFDVFLEVPYRAQTAQPLDSRGAMEYVVTSLEPTTDLSTASDDDTKSRFISALHGKRVLLVIDDAPDAAAVAPLLDAANARVIVTTRHHFPLAGAREEHLVGLDREDAIRLLQSIARRVGDEAGDVVDACGALALAVRLAGNRIRMDQAIAPRALAERIRNLRGAIEHLEEERAAEQSLTAALESSYQALDDDHREVLRRLAVMAATFDVEAAAGVTCLPTDVASVRLEALRRRSLLEYEGGRYAMHDMIRAFCLDKLQGDEEQSARLLHASHYAAVLASADGLFLKGGEDVAKGLALFDEERPHVEAAWAWAYGEHGSNHEALRLVSRLADAGVYCLDLRHHPATRIEWSTAAVAASRELRDRQGEGSHLGNLGNAYARLGDVRKAIEHYEEALVIRREIGDRQGEGSDLGNLGLACARLGEVRKAIEHHEEALGISREIGDRQGEGNRLGNLGLAYARLGEVRKAIEHYEEALAIFEDIESPHAETVRRWLEAARSASGSESGP